MVAVRCGALVLMMISACSFLRCADANCRDRVKHPFSSESIWNVAIGSDARFISAGIFAQKSRSEDLCAKGKVDFNSRRGCPGWNSSWTADTCLSQGCCYDPHPSPDPKGIPWCYSNITRSGPRVFYTDIDYMIVASESDPDTVFIDQGWWGTDSECGEDHCCIKSQARQIGTIPFPKNWTVNMTSNNAAAVLMPDRTTLVQFQPLVRCEPGSPILSLPPRNFYASVKNTALPSNMSILGPGTWGAHGGSRLSSIGGTIRLGELLPDAAPISHAIKLMLYAKDYYFPGNESLPCFRWPALNCDGAWNASRDPTNPNYYNGSLPSLRPGALLAIPGHMCDALRTKMQTTLGRKLLRVLTDYGGYLDDNTASDAGAFNVEGGVREEVQEAYGIDLSYGGVAPGAPLYSDLLEIYRSLHIVDNNSNMSIGGGGTPRQPPLPPICPIEATFP